MYDSKKLSEIKEIKKSKFMIYTSITEDIPGLSPAEALYCKVPCICFDLKVLREWYQKSVEYVPLKDVNALARKIDELNSDGAYLEKRGKEGKEFVKENLTDTKVSERI